MTTFVCAGLYYRTCPHGTQNKGEVVESHAHNFDHATWITRGSYRIEAVLPDGTRRNGVFKAFNMVEIKAGVEHKLTALEDGSEYFCIYPSRNPETGEVVQEFNGWDEAYG